MISRKKLFIHFLKQNNAYEQFMFNLNSRKGYFFTPKKFFNYTFDEDFVSNAFNWDDSLQGYGYWDELEDKWLGTLERKSQYDFKKTTIHKIPKG